MAPVLSNDKRKVEQLQTYLRLIAKQDERLPLLAIDGIYGDRTRQTVNEFQRINSLAVTGEVDETTWNEIFRQYSEIFQKNAPARKVDLFRYPDATLDFGQSGITIYLVQTMILAISEVFDNISRIAISGTVDEITNKQIEKLKNIFDLQESIDDKFFFDRLSLLYEQTMLIIHEAQ